MLAVYWTDSAATPSHEILSLFVLFLDLLGYTTPPKGDYCQSKAFFK